MDFKSFDQKSQGYGKSKSASLTQTKIISQDSASDPKSKFNQNHALDHSKPCQSALPSEIIGKYPPSLPKNKDHSSAAPYSKNEFIRNQPYKAPTKKSKPSKPKFRQLTNYESDKLEQFGFPAGEFDYLILDNDMPFDQFEFDQESSEESYDEELEESDDERYVVHRPDYDDENDECREDPDEDYDEYLDDPDDPEEDYDEYCEDPDEEYYEDPDQDCWDEP